MERNQSCEIYDYIKNNENCSTQDIVDGTGWVRYIVEMVTSIMIKENLIKITGHDTWDDPQFKRIS